MYCFHTCEDCSKSNESMTEGQQAHRTIKGNGGEGGASMVYGLVQPGSMTSGAREDPRPGEGEKDG